MGIIVGVRGDGGHGTLNQRSRTHMDSQKLKQQAQVLHWSVLGVLNICCDSWLGIFTQAVGSSVLMISFACSWYSFPSTGVSCPGLI